MSRAKRQHRPATPLGGPPSAPTRTVVLPAPRAHAPGAARRGAPGPALVPLWPGFAVAALVGLVYLAAASQGTFRFSQSSYPHHVLIADAWLHGQLHARDEILEERREEFYRERRSAQERYLRARGEQLSEAAWTAIRARSTPPTEHDWSVLDGRRYGYWGPAVPALLLPYVAAVGPRASDVLASCLLGMATVLLTFLVVREGGRGGLVAVSAPMCAALALLLGLGTVFFFLTVSAQVWFFSQTTAACFTTLAIWLALRGGQGLPWTAAAGAAFGAAVLARSAVLATAGFFYGAILALAPAEPTARARWRHALWHAVAFSVPLLAAGLVLLAYDQARFGDPFESGIRLQLQSGANPRFKQEFVDYGLFHPHYLPRNLYYYFVNPWLRLHRATGALTFDPWGNSMLLVTPPLIYVARAVRRDRLAIALWAGVVPSLTLLLFFQGSGWFGFGNRYLLDVLPLAILLVAIGMRGRLTRVAILLIALAVAVNAWGTYRFLLEQG